MKNRIFATFLPGLSALLFSAAAYSARLTPAQVSMHIEMADTFYVYQDIPFRVVLTPNVAGKLVTWDTASVYAEIYRLERQGAPIDEGDEVISSDLDRRNENAVVYQGADESEIGFEVFPDAELVSVTGATPYVKEASFEQDIYPEAQASAELLGPGHYKLAVEYVFAIETDDDYGDEDAPSLKAEAEFRLTTEGKIGESINYWLGILQNPDANERHVRSAWLALEDYLGQIFRAPTEDLMAMMVRENAMAEYELWWEHNKDKVVLVVEDDGSERLEDPQDKACVSCYEGPVLTDFGDRDRETTEATLELTGEIQLGFAGLRSITVKNNRIPDQMVDAERTGYKTWKVTVPLEPGDNELILTATDYVYHSLSTTLNVKRIEP